MSPDSNYQPRFNIVLHQPEIPGNTGAIGRTCVALQAKLWLVQPLGFRIDEKTLRRAGLDYWQHLEWETVENWDALVARVDAEASDRRGRIWTFTKTAGLEFGGVEFSAGDWLVFGSETRGLPDSILRGERSTNLRIPTSDLVRSLNLSCSVAVAGYEIFRQVGFR